MDMAIKDAGETRLYSFDFSAALSTGETLSGAASVSVAESGLPSADLTAGAPAVRSTSVTALVSGGAPGRIYVLSCSCGTTAGQSLTVDGGLSIG